MPPKTKPDASRHIVSVRITDAKMEEINHMIAREDLTRSEFMEWAVSLALAFTPDRQFHALANTQHRQFTHAEPPTESQRSGMRARTLAILRDGKPYTPGELAVRLGCGEGAASAYCRDARKGKYGGHNILSKPIIRGGKRTSVYWLATTE